MSRPAHLALIQVCSQRRNHQFSKQRVDFLGREGPLEIDPPGQHGHEGCAEEMNEKFEWNL